MPKRRKKENPEITTTVVIHSKPLSESQCALMQQLAEENTRVTSLYLNLGRSMIGRILHLCQWSKDEPEQGKPSKLYPLSEDGWHVVNTLLFRHGKRITSQVIGSKVKEGARYLAALMLLRHEEDRRAFQQKKESVRRHNRRLNKAWKDGKLNCTEEELKRKRVPLEMRNKAKAIIRVKGGRNGHLKSYEERLHELVTRHASLQTMRRLEDNLVREDENSRDRYLPLQILSKDSSRFLENTETGDLYVAVQILADGHPMAKMKDRLKKEFENITFRLVYTPPPTKKEREEGKLAKFDLVRRPTWVVFPLDPGTYQLKKLYAAGNLPVRAEVDSRFENAGRKQRIKEKAKELFASKRVNVPQKKWGRLRDQCFREARPLVNREVRQARKKQELRDLIANFVLNEETHPGSALKLVYDRQADRVEVHATITELAPERKKPHECHRLLAVGYSSLRRKICCVLAEADGTYLEIKSLTLPAPTKQGRVYTRGQWKNLQSLTEERKKVSQEVKKHKRENNPPPRDLNVRLTQLNREIRRLRTKGSLRVATPYAEKQRQEVGNMIRVIVQLAEQYDAHVTIVQPPHNPQKRAERGTGRKDRGGRERQQRSLPFADLEKRLNLRLKRIGYPEAFVTYGKLRICPNCMYADPKNVKDEDRKVAVKNGILHCQQCGHKRPEEQAAALNALPDIPRRVREKKRAEEKNKQRAAKKAANSTKTNMRAKKGKKKARK